MIAYRPLTLDKNDFALSAGKHTLSYANLKLEGSSRLQETLPSRCAFMVSVIQSKVHFIYQPVKEFLLGEFGTIPSACRAWQKSLSLEESHHLMAEICLRSITFPEIRLDQANIHNALLPEVQRNMEPNSYCQKHGILSYSANYWAEHFLNKRNNKGIESVRYVLENSDCGSIRGRRSSDNGSTLHAASAGGYMEIVLIMLENGADMIAGNGKYSTALA